MADNTKPLLTEEHFRMISGLANTYNYSQIANKLGCSVSTVSKFCKKYKIKSNYSKVRIELEEKLNEIVELLKTTETKKVAERYGVTAQYISSLLRANGYKCRQDMQRERILELLKENASEMYLEEFSKTFGFARDTVRCIALANGISFSNNHRLDSKKDEIEKLIHNTPLTEVARILNIDRASLLGYVTRNNLPYLKVPNKEWLPGHIVYAYYDKDGVVRYYGEGSKEERAYAFGGHKSKGYSKYFSDCDPQVKILYYGLSKEEAQKIEQDLVTENLNSVATVYNHPKTSRRKKPIDFETINSLLYYDETSPTCLRWRVSDRYGNKVKDAPAGTLARNRYSSIKLSKLGTFKCHVLIWLLYTGSIDITKCIDHINGDKSDNRTSNLREVSHSVNVSNKRSRTNTGYKNLHFSTSRNGYTLYWSENGKRVSKFFKVSEYGSKELALTAALDLRQEKITSGLILGKDER